jgi:hypothetical protein
MSTSTTDSPTIDVYPVGLLDDLRRFRGALKNASRRSAIRGLVADLDWGIWDKVRCRDWHRVKLYLNGYLAETTPFPEDVKRCGSGWMKVRAVRSLRRQYEKAGVTWES